MIKYFSLTTLTFSFVILFQTISIKADVQYAPTIYLPEYGSVRGIVKEVKDLELVNGTSRVYFYQGIPYGKAKRFEKAVKADKWTTLYDATNPRYQCPQPFSINITNNLNQSEDCLFVNVWSTNVNRRQLLPVMVWIHGGGLEAGTIFDPITDGGMLSLNGKVIVVSIAYRLGPFGFMYSGDAEGQAPGNLGFHDQILGLKWVQNNIKYFGGDPNQVTIFGESAGSWSVGSLILSPLAKGLFQRAIMQSGAAIPMFGLYKKDDALKNMLMLAKNLDCTNNTDASKNNMTELTDCIKGKEMEDISEKSITLQFKSIYGDDFMPLSPIEALKSGQVNYVDLMFGVNRDEGSTFSLRYLSGNLTLEETRNIIRNKSIISLFSDKNVDKIVKFYTKHLNDHSSQDDFRYAISDMFGDMLLTCPTILFGEAYNQLVKSNKMNTKLYSYRLMQPIKALIKDNPFLRVKHGMDVPLVFGRPLKEIIGIIEEEEDLSQDMMLSWAKFACGGKPGPIGTYEIEWIEAFEKGPNTEFMYLEADNYHMVPGFYQNRCNNLWKQFIFV